MEKVPKLSQLWVLHNKDAAGLMPLIDVFDFKTETVDTTVSIPSVIFD